MQMGIAVYLNQLRKKPEFAANSRASRLPIRTRNKTATLRTTRQVRIRGVRCRPEARWARAPYYFLLPPPLPAVEGGTIFLARK